MAWTHSNSCWSATSCPRRSSRSTASYGLCRPTSPTPTAQRVRPLEIMATEGLVVFARCKDRGTNENRGTLSLPELCWLRTNAIHPSAKMSVCACSGTSQPKRRRRPRSSQFAASNRVREHRSDAASRRCRSSVVPVSPTSRARPGVRHDCHASTRAPRASSCHGMLQHKGSGAPVERPGHLLHIATYPAEPCFCCPSRRETHPRW